MSFHEGELLVQERAGVLADAGRVGRFIRKAVAPAAGEFLATRRFVVLTAATADEHVWVTILAGPPGFVDVSEDGTGLTIAAELRSDAPITPAIRPGVSVGVVAIDFAARRRTRVNGTVQSVGKRITIDVQEAFGNCPKYIHAYQPAPDGATLTTPARSGVQLDAYQRRWIERAETFFLGTLHPEAGADASHRGGAPGFVRVTGASELAWGDYPGNKMFNSLGNAAVHPPAGILFLDLETGSTLQLSGHLQIDWSPEASAEFPRSERVVRFRIDQVVETPGTIPLRWAHGTPSTREPPAP